MHPIGIPRFAEWHLPDRNMSVRVKSYPSGSEGVISWDLLRNRPRRFQLRCCRVMVYEVSMKWATASRNRSGTARSCKNGYESGLLRIIEYFPGLNPFG